MISLFLLNMLLLAGLCESFSGGGGWGKGVEIPLVTAPCYRSEPEITTVLMGRFMQTVLCQIVIYLKFSHLQWSQSFCLNNKYNQ